MLARFADADVHDLTGVLAFEKYIPALTEGRASHRRCVGRGISDEIVLVGRHGGV